jgi:hypothetical protein
MNDDRSHERREYQRPKARPHNATVERVAINLSQDVAE